MKNFLLSLAIASTCLYSYSQSFNVGGNFGIPIGSFNEYDFTIGADFNYLWKGTEKLEFGITTGYNYFTRLSGNSKGGGYYLPNVEYKILDISMIPIAGAIRMHISKAFLLGADIGYAIIFGDLDHLGEGYDKGGLYFCPMVGYNIKDNLLISFSYRAVSIKGGSFEDVSLGQGTIGALTAGIMVGF